MNKVSVEVLVADSLNVSAELHWLCVCVRVCENMCVHAGLDDRLGSVKAHCGNSTQVKLSPGTESGKWMLPVWTSGYDNCSQQHLIWQTY